MHVKHGYEYAGQNDQNRAQNCAQAQRLVENEYAHDHAGAGLKSAENGGALAPDDEGGLLEEHHRAGGDEEGEDDAHYPAHGGSRQGEIAAEQADNKGQHCGDGGNVKAEKKAGDLLVFEGGQKHRVCCIGHAGEEGEEAAPGVERLARSVE